MAQLPGGTVTFLFTDVEGSTRLVQRMGERYADVLGEHHRLLRAAFRAHGGREVDTQGDSFFVAFARARDAVAAAADGQRALAEHRWPDGVTVRVRMGVHTGEPISGPEAYVGVGVQRAARICAAAHGGQVLLSGATRALLEDGLPPGTALRELGYYRLKNFDRAEPLFQLLATGLPEVFPPLRAAQDVPSWGGAEPVLASPATALFGREPDLERLTSLLRNPAVRLVTLAGPGGVGKTRLATEFARRRADDFTEGARFVPLAPLSDDGHIPSAIALALGVPRLEDESTLPALRRFLAARHTLVVLDGFDHLLAGAPLVAELLAACPNLTVLVTSREPLRLSGEYVHAVAPLAVPDVGVAVGPRDLPRFAATAMFLDRARARDHTFVAASDDAAHVVAICRRLDGLPLALELAAARVGVLSVRELAARLERSLSVLGSGPRDAPARHATLRATIDWSVRLPTAEERRAFARFAVFAGGATVEAAEAVTGATLDVLDSLVAKQLIVRTQDRLAMPEITREYAGELLDGHPDVDEVREHHASWYLQLAEEHAPRLVTARRAAALSRLENEIDNLRAAMSWAIEARRAELAAAPAGALGPYWWRAHHQDEGRSWLDAVLAATPKISAGMRARALFFRARVNCRLPQRMPEHDLSTAAELFHSAHDDAGAAKCLAFLAVSERHRGEHEIALSRLQEALRVARRTDDSEAVAIALSGAVIGAVNYATASGVAAEAVAALRRVGNVLDIGSVYGDTGYLAIRDGRYAEALPWLEQALSTVREIGDPFMLLVVHGNQGLAHLFLGNVTPAKEHFLRSVELCRHAAFHDLVDEGLLGLAAVAALEDRLGHAARLAGAARAHAGSTRTVDDDIVQGRLRERFLSPARARYGARRWDRYEDQGRALTFPEAVDLALESHIPRTTRAEARSGADRRSGHDRRHRARRDQR